MPRRPSINEKKIPAIPIRTNHIENLAPINRQKSSSFQTIKEGVAFGLGNSIAHRIVGAFMTPSQIQMPLENTNNKQKEYEQCIKEYDNKSVCDEMYGS
jgi:hypothetical protein